MEKSSANRLTLRAADGSCFRAKAKSRSTTQLGNDSRPPGAASLVGADAERPRSSVRPLTDVTQPCRTSDAKSPRRTQIGRSSDAKGRKAPLPQVVPSNRVRAQYQNLRTVRTQNPGTPYWGAPQSATGLVARQWDRFLAPLARSRAVRFPFHQSLATPRLSTIRHRSTSERSPHLGMSTYA